MPTLIAATDRLTEQVKGFRDDVKALRRRHWYQVGLSVVLALALVWQYSAQVDRQNDTRRARVASCHQYNRQQQVQIVAEIAQSHDLVNALAQGRPPGSDRDRDVKAYNSAHDKIIRSGHPSRDCTKAGIAAYLSGATVPKESK